MDLRNRFLSHSPPRTYLVRQSEEGDLWCWLWQINILSLFAAFRCLYTCIHKCYRFGGHLSQNPLRSPPSEFFSRRHHLQQDHASVYNLLTSSCSSGGVCAFKVLGFLDTTRSNNSSNNNNNTVSQQEKEAQYWRWFWGLWRNSNLQIPVCRQCPTWNADAAADRRF